MVPERPLVDMIVFGRGLAQLISPQPSSQLIATQLICVWIGPFVVGRGALRGAEWRWGDFEVGRSVKRGPERLQKLRFQTRLRNTDKPSTQFRTVSSKKTMILK